MEDITVGRYFNLIVCIIVVVSGLYWLRVLDQKWKGEYRFLYRAFVCWWLAWLVWVVIWTLKSIYPSIPNILNLTLTDLNAIFWILVYFNLTRGNQFRIMDSLSLSISIILVLAIGYGGLYLYFGDDSARAYEIQESVELCVGFVATMLIGWAFALRYNTNVVFVVGYAYGFAQPFAFKAFFDVAENESTRKLFIVVLIVLAFLKIVWATVVTRYFLQIPETSESLVMKSNSSSSSGLFQNWTIALAVQTIVLFAVFMFLLFRKMPNFLSEVAKTIGQLVGFFSILVGAVKLWGHLTSKLNLQDDKQKIVDKR